MAMVLANMAPFCAPNSVKFFESSFSACSGKIPMPNCEPHLSKTSLAFIRAFFPLATLTELGGKSLVRHFESSLIGRSQSFPIKDSFLVSVSNAPHATQSSKALRRRGMASSMSPLLLASLYPPRAILYSLAQRAVLNLDSKTLCRRVKGDEVFLSKCDIREVIKRSDVSLALPRMWDDLRRPQADWLACRSGSVSAKAGAS